MNLKLTFSGRFNYRHGGGVSFHNHPDDYQLQLVYDGRATIIIDNVTYHAGPNSIFFIRRGSTHEFSVDTEGGMKTLELKFEASGEEAERLISYISTSLDDKDGQFFSLFSNIVTEGYQKLFSYKELSNALLLSVLSLMARRSRSLTPYPKIEQTERKVYQSKLMQDVTEFIGKNIDRKYTLPELASECGYNKDYLYRMIKKETGLTAIQFVNKVKYDQAKKLIQHTELSLSEIAWNLGFGSLQYFSRFFKEQSGIPPSEYMQKVRNTVRIDY